MFPRLSVLATTYHSVQDTSVSHLNYCNSHLTVLQLLIWVLPQLILLASARMTSKHKFNYAVCVHTHTHTPHSPLPLLIGKGPGSLFHYPSWLPPRIFPSFPRAFVDDVPAA